jgi:hypothetical protein
MNKECRQRTPADVALVSEGVPLRNRSGCIEEQEENPAEIMNPAGFVVDWTDEP